MYDEPDAPLALEVASSPSHSTRGLVRFRDAFPRFQGGCWLIHPGARVRRPSEDPEGIGRYPLERFLFGVGRIAEGALLARHAKPARRQAP